MSLMLHVPSKPLRASVERQACAADSTMARLLIHAAVDAECATLPLLLSRLRRLRPRAMAAPRCQRPALSTLRIADLDGRSYFSADELPSEIELRLPAGTYHVSVSHGSQQRRYTVALGQGAAFDLHLRGD